MCWTARNDADVVRADIVAGIKWTTFKPASPGMRSLGLQAASGREFVRNPRDEVVEETRKHVRVKFSIKLIRQRYFMNIKYQMYI